MPHLGTQMHARPSIMRVDARAPLTHTHTVHVLASFRHPRNMAKFGSEHVCGSQSGKSKVQRAYVGASLDVIKAKKSQKPEQRAAAREAALRCESLLSWAESCAASPNSSPTLLQVPCFGPDGAA